MLVFFLSIYAPYHFWPAEITHVRNSSKHFHVFGNLHDIDFALSCMEINAKISIN